MKTWLRYLVEVFVIIFSVLAAFGLDQWREENQEAKKRKEALAQILQEIQFNYGVLKDNRQLLMDFNQHAQVMYGLDTSFLEPDNQDIIIERTALDSIVNSMGENPRIELLQPTETVSETEVKISSEMRIDFFLGRMSFSTWEANRASGALIGIKPETFARLAQIYDAFQTDFGYSERDYHHAMLSGFNEFGDGKSILDATTKLEAVYSAKLIHVEGSYEETVTYLERIIEE